jgi:hypothetical protein
MEILKKNVELSEVLGCYERENQGSESFVWARGYLSKKSLESGGKWVLAILDSDEIRNIMLPDHRHPAENPNILIPKPGMTVAAAAGRVRDITQETGLCWDNISFHKGRDFSLVHVFLQRQNGGLLNLDGLHRLLAWELVGKEENVAAYIVGMPETIVNVV